MDASSETHLESDEPSEGWLRLHWAGEGGNAVGEELGSQIEGRGQRPRTKRGVVRASVG
jgi:hypothetical protein